MPALIVFKRARNTIPMNIIDASIDFEISSDAKNKPPK
ncbi:hypothetical protein PVA8_349 [Vibrio phage PVA8]|nr:hypothetical protein [Vibrio phage PC-Liy1]URQ03335.1 hypothetical protein PVA8_349 [Vibrio phage PVA8]WBM59068.1 hypothetical protein vBValMPVA8_346 [Vibrio phage vB_ValM_PVA8]